MVKGKNKEQFEIWFLLRKDLQIMFVGENILQIFSELPFEMQIGVYLAYYDSLDIVIETTKNDVLNWWFFTINLEFFNAEYKSRNEAYKEAFKRANKLINNK